jgi:hypothetical protein
MGSYFFVNGGVYPPLTFGVAYLVEERLIKGLAYRD